MAKRKSKQHKGNEKDFLKLDDKIYPVIGIFGRSVEITYPNEYQLIDSMRVNQSATFPRTKLNVINAIRGRVTKLTGKKFTVKRVDDSNSRIWRLPDKTRRFYGNRYTKAKKEREKQEVNNG